MTAPPFAYYGGKTRIADRIVDLFGPHDQYVEPFAGGLSVLLAKSPAKLEIVNDLNGRLISFWRVLRDRPDDLARACALTPHSRAELQLAMASAKCPPADELEAARLVWVELAQARMASLRRTGWRHFVNPAGTSRSMPAYLDAYVDRIATAAERLHNVTLECRDGVEVAQIYGVNPTAVLYIDPPYPASTRRASRYEIEMAGEEEHRRLAEVLHQSRAAVYLSGYAGSLYDELYASWHRIDFAATSGEGEDRSRVESVWTNRPHEHLALFGGAR